MIKNSRIFLKTGPLVMCLMFLLSLVVSKVGIAAEWKLLEEKEGIQVWAQAVEGSQYQKFKASLNIKATIDSIMGVMDDASACPHWVHQCKEQTVLKCVSFLERYNYQITDLPWPVDDRDSIYHVLIVPDPANKQVTFQLSGKADYKPKEDAYIRVASMEGSYVFKIISENEVNVTWEQHVEPGGNVPGWLVNQMIVELPFKTLAKLRELVAKEPYKSAKLKYDDQMMPTGFTVKGWKSCE
ncbi:START domain-containing protein [Deltaproteobacteria bacterium TL4]